MAKYDVYATVTGSKYLGMIEAKDEETAIDKAEEEYIGEAVDLCHQCTSDKVEELSITAVHVEARVE